MKKIIFAYIFSCILFIEICSAKLPTLYEYYTNNGNKIDIGLEANGPEFTLNHKPLVIYSGSLHYFRIVPEYWPQTLQKFKAAGLNTVQFYIPWNRHEPRPGQFDFDSYGLNLTEFLNEIRKADMFAIVRPGPYICAEWDLGGFPSWLLKDPHMKLRTPYDGYLEPVRKYYRKIFKIINQFQFTKNGGPIIALQVENELFGDFDNWQNVNQSLKYLDKLHQMIVDENHFEQLLFTSDPVSAAKKLPVQSLKYLLETANLNVDALDGLTQLKNKQKNRPIFVSEFWPGWFDQWNDPSHHRYSTLLFEQQISEILFQVNGSVNFYMFIGGTNFAFYNGARITTSYDYDAPLSESGNYTEKYYKTRELYTKLVATGRQPAIEIPSKPPSIVMAKAYGDLTMNEYLNFEQIISQMKPIVMKQALFMEFIDNSSGFGFILYRLKTKPIQTLNITGPIKDRALIMINGKILWKIEDGAKNLNIHLKNQSEWFADQDDEYNLDILVENLGRANYVTSLMNTQRKGINSTILLDGNVCNEIHTYTFDFNQSFMKSTVHSKWNPITTNDDNEKGPRLYRTQFRIESNPTDTFMKLPGWTYGNVFINNFNIGRFDHRGPQKALYIPGPLLRSGENVIHIFELDKRGSKIQLIDHPILE
ncbi:beta-galactosidase-1-like protein 3 [Dermatophagoides pteronyssinus]|uniref:beta-galactosidase-1-like protein 3 n=1 Tax=Dermatophagoides pteronyssinus TaxID=6956 RepID=UPI003F67FB7B